MDHLYDFQVYDQVRQYLWHLPYLRPDHTIYLDVSLKTLQLRRAAEENGVPEIKYFLHDPQFLTYTRNYFIDQPHLPVSSQVTVLPSCDSEAKTAELVRDLVKLWSARD
ncbi:MULTISPECIES: hypothetical protein [unclassified Streptomyces]|uniref:hypothetical protein n=1 Tax=unclassified Streptomyces TaxID=2593676 RepID=UPI0032548367